MFSKKSENLQQNSFVLRCGKIIFGLVKNGIIPFSAVSVVSPFGGDLSQKSLKKNCLKETLEHLVGLRYLVVLLLVVKC